MKNFVRLVFTMALLFSSCLIKAQGGSPNRMAYHEVQGFEIKIGFFAGNTVDTYYLLITNTPDQFAAPQRVVLGVNKNRAIIDLSKILDCMNTGRNFIYTDKTGTEYTFTRIKKTKRYVVAWDGSENGYCPITTSTRSIERSIQWLTETTTWNEAQALVMKINVDELENYTYAYTPAIRFID